MTDLASPLDVSNRVLEQAAARLDRLEEKLAALLEPILEQAGAAAASRFARKATNHLTATALVAAGPGVESNSTMVALKPRADEAVRIALEDGFDADTLHVTLAYLGELDGRLDLLQEALAPVSAVHAPLEGVVGGVGIFAGEDGGAPSILLPDVPGLGELRLAVVQALADAGIDYARSHGFTPHITVRYHDEVPAALDRVPALEPLHFDALLVVRGDVVEYELPLHGTPPLTAAAGEPPAWSAPAGDEIIDVDEMVKKLRTKTDPVRLALIEQAMTPTLRAAGLHFDTTNPFTAKVLAQSGRQVRSIAETTRANVMRTIGAAHREGLTIPDTAKAIRAGFQSASPARARMIARTELAGAVNGGSLAATQIVSSAAGIAYQKQWLTAEGAVHPRHEEYEGLDGQTVPLEEAFDVGGAPVMYPGDPDGEPGETINCRCALAYVEGEQTPGGDASAAPPPDLSGDPVELGFAGVTTGLLGEGTPILAGADPGAGMLANAQGWIDALPAPDRLVVNRYTQDGYADINAHVVGREPPMKWYTSRDEIAADAAKLRTVVESAPKLPEGTTLYRGTRIAGVNPDLYAKLSGIRSEVLHRIGPSPETAAQIKAETFAQQTAAIREWADAKMPVGSELQTSGGGFQSMTASPDFASNFGTAGEPALVFRVENASSGAPIWPLGHVGGEAEVLVGPDVTYRVKSITVNPMRDYTGLSTQIQAGEKRTIDRVVVTLEEVPRAEAEAGEAGGAATRAADARTGREAAAQAEALAPREVLSIQGGTRGALVEQRQTVESAISNLGQLVRLPDRANLPAEGVKVTMRRNQTSRGHFKTWTRSYGPNDRRLEKVEINVGSPRHPAVTMAHEFGHFIDYTYIGENPFFFATKNAAALPEGELRDALVDLVAAWKDSDSYKTLEARGADSTARYYRSNVELWARSFSQWAAERAPADSPLAQEMSREIAHEAEQVAQLGDVPGWRFYPEFWQPGDFDRIRPAIERVLRAAGLLAS